MCSSCVQAGVIVLISLGKNAFLFTESFLSWAGVWVNQVCAQVSEQSLHKLIPRRLFVITDVGPGLYPQSTHLTTLTTLSKNYLVLIQRGVKP